MQGASSTACCSGAGAAPREVDFAYYSLLNGDQSTLNLVSDSPQPINLSIVVYSARGHSAIAPPYVIQPGQKLALDMGQLLAKMGMDAAGEFGEGSVAVYFVGTIMPVVGQVTISNPAQRLIHEAEMVENDPGRTDIPAVLDGLWWGLGGGRDARIVVTNMASRQVTADVYLDYLGARHASAPLIFAPNEQKVLSVTQLLTDLGASPAQAPEGGITIMGHGVTPSLIAQGKISDPATGFSTTLRFPGAETQPASALHASGVPIGTPSKDSPFAGMGDFVPHLALRNLLAAPQQVTVTVEYPQPPASSAAPASSPASSSSPVVAPVSSSAASSSAPKVIMPPPQPGDANDHPEWGPGTGATVGTVTLAPISVPGQSTVDFSFAAVMSQLPLPLPFVSIRVQYSGQAGSMVAELASVDQAQDLVIDSKLMNEGWTWSGSGANPWHLDSQTESFLFLTNEGGQTARIGFSVTANGVRYYLTKLKLQPHETRAINFRALRDAQAADFKQHQIPASATDGAVNWVRIDNVPVEGRVVVIERNGGTASNYDCNNCGCPTSYFSTEISPSPVDLLPGSCMNCALTEVTTSCNGTYYYASVTDTATWSTADTSIAYMDSGVAGKVYATTKGGTTSIITSYKAYKYVYANHICNSSGVGGGGTFTCNASPNYGCGDPLNSIIQQYYDYPTGSPPFIPGCSSFTNSAHTTNFTFAELNVNQEYPWAILVATFLTGLQNTRSLYGPMTVNSGYREPAYNALPSVGGAPGSQHVFGAAADIASNSTTWLALAHDANVNSACVEPESQSGSTHVHMDWRGTCPSNWPTY